MLQVRKHCYLWYCLLLKASFDVLVCYRNALISMNVTRYLLFLYQNHSMFVVICVQYDMLYFHPDRLSVVLLVQYFSVHVMVWTMSWRHVHWRNSGRKFIESHWEILLSWQVYVFGLYVTSEELPVCDLVCNWSHQLVWFVYVVPIQHAYHHINKQKWEIIFDCVSLPESEFKIRPLRFQTYA